MGGCLYLCATPIGNLEDITFRCVRILEEVDLIAAEDTRNSKKLLNHYEIKTPMTSYHEHNQIEKGPYLIQQLKEGKNIALISDAGTPGISDPGEALVALCHEEGIVVRGIPGPSACITGLTISGLSTKRFAFEGFLPSEKKGAEQRLEELKEETYTLIFYEAPHRLRKTLSLLEETLGNRKIALLRELTKKYEEVFLGDVSKARKKYEVEEPRGEYVLVLEGVSPSYLKEKKQEEWLEMTLEAHMHLYEERGYSRKEAMKQVAKDRGVGKREIYQKLLEGQVVQEG